MSTHSLCANNANVIQAIRCVGDLSGDVGICWPDGRSSGAALTPEPHRCPILVQSSVTKRWKISNAPEPTRQYAGQSGASELRGGASLRKTRDGYSRG